jgi:hypothetical protein
MFAEKPDPNYTKAIKNKQTSNRTYSQQERDDTEKLVLK